MIAVAEAEQERAIAGPHPLRAPVGTGYRTRPRGNPRAWRPHRRPRPKP
jgi:hypothetical protein